MVPVDARSSGCVVPVPGVLSIPGKNGYELQSATKFANEGALELQAKGRQGG